jgi:nitroreductase
MDFQEVLRRRRMVRSFEGTPVDRTTLDRLLSAALRAPSAGFTQAVDLLALTDSEARASYWEAVTTEEWRSRSRRATPLAAAPVVVVVVVDPHAYFERYSEDDKRASGLTSLSSWPVAYWWVDAGFVILNLLHGAVDAGLGACLLGTFRGEEELKARFGIPERKRIAGSVLIGHPGPYDPPSASTSRTRRSLEEAVHRNRW